MILNILKELSELNNDYSLVPAKTEIKKEILSDYQLKIAGEYNIPIGYGQKLVPNFFDWEEHMLHYKKLQLYLSVGLNYKQKHRALEFNQSQSQSFIEFNSQKRMKVEKKGDKKVNRTN